MESGDGKYLEKRFARIERWLKRCVAACGSGSWGSALMEIECMEAETREIHGELWRAAEAASIERAPRKLASSCFFWFRVAFAATAIVLSAVFPLSMEIDGGHGVRAGDYSIEILSSSEAEILNALRENLSSANRGRVVVSVELPEKTAVAAPLAAGAAMAAPPPRAAEGPAETRGGAPGAAGAEEPEEGAVPGKADIHPSVEDVISLIQVGQRALRVSEPAITVVK
ncbi:MAG: hypothetical protein LBS75_04405 [Synergistaceae bacterium]|jgi:hypothetical protein|nr:hypothetical protein [Synergistaceae bacterium]